MTPTRDRATIEAELKGATEAVQKAQGVVDKLVKELAEDATRLAVSEAVLVLEAIRDGRAAFDLRRLTVERPYTITKTEFVWKPIGGPHRTIQLIVRELPANHRGAE